MISKTHVLVQTHENWADEMDIYGYRILTFKQYEKRIEELQEEFEEAEGAYMWWIGTNEEIEYENFQQFFDTLTVTELTAEEAKALIATLGAPSNGHSLL